MSAFEVSIKRAVQIHCCLMAAVLLRVYNGATLTTNKRRTYPRRINDNETFRMLPLFRRGS